MKKYLIAGILIIIACLFTNTAYSQNANYFYAKGNYYLTSGKMTDAITFYNQAIAKDKSFFEAYLGLSIAYKELENYDEALKSVQEAIKLRPDYYQAYYNLGLVLEKQNKNEDAIKAYEKFLKGVSGASKFSDAPQRIQKLRNFTNER